MLRKALKLEVPIVKAEVIWDMSLITSCWPLSSARTACVCQPRLATEDDLPRFQELAGRALCQDVYMEKHVNLIDDSHDRLCLQSMRVRPGRRLNPVGSVR